MFRRTSLALCVYSLLLFCNGNSFAQRQQKKPIIAAQPQQPAAPKPQFGYTVRPVLVPPPSVGPTLPTFTPFASGSYKILAKPNPAYFGDGYAYAGGIFFPAASVNDKGEVAYAVEWQSRNGSFGGGIYTETIKDGKASYREVARVGKPIGTSGRLLYSVLDVQINSKGEVAYIAKTSGAQHNNIAVFVEQKLAIRESPDVHDFAGLSDLEKFQIRLRSLYELSGNAFTLGEDGKAYIFVDYGSIAVKGSNSQDCVLYSTNGVSWNSAIPIPPDGQPDDHIKLISYAALPADVARRVRRMQQGIEKRQANEPVKEYMAYYRNDGSEAFRLSEPFPAPFPWREGQPVPGPLVTLLGSGYGDDLKSFPGMGTPSNGISRSIHVNETGQPAIMHLVGGGEGLWGQAGLIATPFTYTVQGIGGISSYFAFETNGLRITKGVDGHLDNHKPLDVQMNRTGQILLRAKPLPDDTRVFGFALATPSNTLAPTPQRGDVVVYRDKGAIVHTGVVTEVQGTVIKKVISKWGEYGLYEHDPNDSIYGRSWTVWHTNRKLGNTLLHDAFFFFDWSILYYTDKGRLEAWVAVSEVQELSPPKTPKTPDEAEKDIDDPVYGGYKGLYKKLRAIKPPSVIYNCHGYVFTNGVACIQPPDLHKNAPQEILNDNEYTYIKSFDIIVIEH